MNVMLTINGATIFGPVNNIKISYQSKYCRILLRPPENSSRLLVF